MAAKLFEKQCLNPTVTSETNTLELKLRSFITKNVQAMLGRPLTIGAEIEFFVLDTRGRLATIEQTQELLRRLLSMAGWSAFPDPSQRDLAISSASQEHGGGRYSKVKYEYPPHMLEIAFAFHQDLNQLNEDVKSVWQDLESASQSVGLTLSFRPFADIDQAIAQPPLSKKIHDLNESRRLNLEALGLTPDPRIYLFPAFVGGTQIHVGGCDWMNDPEIINQLYLLESKLPLYGSLLAGESAVEAVEILERRTSLYRSCFPNMCLTAFPDLNEWTIEHWLNGLFSSPSVPSSGALLYAGKSCLSLPKESKPDIDHMTRSLRDLQYVRPRFLGTIEFRADPTVSSVEDLMAIAAWRLAQCLISTQPSHFKRTSFRKLLSHWEAARQALHVTSEQLDILHLAHEVLKARGKQEERFLKGLES